jgi:ribose 5-phosphate isomerase B
VKIYIGADHQGFELKQKLAEYLSKNGYEIVDEGSQQPDQTDDFTEFAGRVVTAMLASGDPEAKGILICGSGQGMCMAANRFKGIRASLVWDEFEAKSARNDDDSNVLCLPARELIDLNHTLDLVNAWLKTPFAGADRYIRRIKKLDTLSYSNPKTKPAF